MDTPRVPATTRELLAASPSEHMSALLREARTRYVNPLVRIERCLDVIYAAPWLESVGLMQVYLTLVAIMPQAGTLIDVPSRYGEEETVVAMARMEELQSEMSDSYFHAKLSATEVADRILGVLEILPKAARAQYIAQVLSQGHLPYTDPVVLSDEMYPPERVDDFAYKYAVFMAQVPNVLTGSSVFVARWFEDFISELDDPHDRVIAAGVLFEATQQVLVPSPINLAVTVAFAGFDGSVSPSGVAEA